MNYVVWSLAHLAPNPPNSTLCMDILSLIAALALSPTGTPPLGPRGWPIIGNAFQLPREKHWLKYHAWAKEYGDVFRFTTFGETTVILGSAQAASDLLDARGMIYSDRPTSTLAGDIVGWNKGLGYARFVPSSSSAHLSRSNISPYPLYSNARFRALRKFFHTSIGPRASSNPELIAMQEQERARLLWRLFKEGSENLNGCDFGNTIRQSSGSLILLLLYGYRVRSEGHDPLVQIVEDAMAGFSRASDPDAFWIDRWPALRYIPTWFPGASFHRASQRMKYDRVQLYDVPFDYVREQLEKSTALPSIVASVLSDDRQQSPGKLRAEEELIKAAAASLYSGTCISYHIRDNRGVMAQLNLSLRRCTGGAETTPSALLSFLLAMLLYPDVQRCAQAELDAVLGPPSASAGGRLPVVEDRDNLPYVSALIKEVWRWNPSVPLGLAHRVTQDDVYRGLLIKEGTTVYANIWAILHDEQTYPSPFSFYPGRFLNVDGSLKALDKMVDPSWIAFGFGRRICPGMFLAENSVFLYIASILYIFDVAKARDAYGQNIEPEVDYTGFISHPKPFQCRIVPRSTAAERHLCRITQHLHDIAAEDTTTPHTNNDGFGL
ncbi:cytochrome P450 [Artomyces pyxidatus]|uniref:Cytochrome P450 n=1 Tax=Artomyces pyxidatus TaxID=48021 RepID=A0ACB8T2T7_9AGAM|nr:cytochrome P450 [Artomyces pyxidatus]